MRKPRPIKLKGLMAELSCNGYRDQDAKPYLFLLVKAWGSEFSGYILDRDVRRLRAWCDDCLRLRYKKRAG